MQYIDKVEEWINRVTDSLEKAELLKLEAEIEIESRFSSDLEFGTGGMRGIMGLGTNRMNTYTVRRATQGLANYMMELGEEDRKNKVVIAYDSRNNSYEFARETAQVFAANGIETYLFESLRPTPELSFAVRYLGCDVGVVITASHNPKEYNGYKVYGKDGGQMVPNEVNKIIKVINNVNIWEGVKSISYEEALISGRIVLIDEEVDKIYIEKISALSINPNLFKESDLKVAYTPLHGSGIKLMDKLFERLLFKDFYIVESQMNPDGDFPTVDSPNPEDETAFKEAIKTGVRAGADILLGTDPDSDRVGVLAVHKDEYKRLTGNQIGALLIDYILTSRKDIDQKNVIVKTIVTSDLGSKIAEKSGLKVINTLTGFKYIGEKIKIFEEFEDIKFLFGYEESYGYLYGDIVRDKDAISSSMLIIEMAIYHKKRGSTLVDRLNELYSTYGYYYEMLETVNFSENNWRDKVNLIMKNFEDINYLKATFEDLNYIESYLSGKRVSVIDGSAEEIGLPRENVTKLIFKDDSWIAIRPSGTEPKLKMYYSMIGDCEAKAVEKYSEIRKKIKGII